MKPSVVVKFIPSLTLHKSGHLPSHFVPKLLAKKKFSAPIVADSLLTITDTARLLAHL